MPSNAPPSLRGVAQESLNRGGVRRGRITDFLTDALKPPAQGLSQSRRIAFLSASNNQ